MTDMTHSIAMTDCNLCNLLVSLEHQMERAGLGALQGSALHATGLCFIMSYGSHGGNQQQCRQLIHGTVHHVAGWAHA